MVELLEQELGQPLPRNHVETRAGDVRDSQADSSRLRRLFPDIDPVPLDVGLKQTVTWMRSIISGPEE